jgi:MFS superfamily sulfate permease-like transporter
MRLRSVLTRPIRRVLAIPKALASATIGRAFGIVKALAWRPIEWASDLGKRTTLALGIVVPFVLGFASIGLGIGVAVLWAVLLWRRRMRDSSRSAE